MRIDDDDDRPDWHGQIIEMLSELICRVCRGPSFCLVSAICPRIREAVHQGKSDCLGSSRS